MKFSLKRVTALATAGLIMVGLVGCGSDSSNTSKADNNDSKTETTMKVTDARGEVTIPADPKRIVDISGNSDILSILGYSVVGTANSDAYDYTKFPTYLEDTLEGAKILGYSMQAEIDLESILALNPDLIIISSVQEGMYEQLQEVAPTVMIELAQIDWTEDLKQVAKIFDKTKQVEDWLADYNKKAVEEGNNIKKAYGEDTSYLAILASAGNIYIFDAAGYGSIFYDEMGLTRPEGMPAQTNISLPVVTYEGLVEIDADVIFAVGTKEDLAALNANSLWQKMPAVQAGKVVELPASPYFNMGYSSVGRLEFINEISSLLESGNE